ncbi:alkaline phosphatase family protein [Chitinophaga agrisoli]|uniref:Alkaline phosphatase family protein n=1 Tax=Chitinophaga agrisoli TaxID=2607653 RepID=A0A5B2W2S9_9BACT|nr:ectonucleotide pyrophosphatase/phosphodiesterase [Chitinophaga agrisoli]KAA2244797.1 alkaline phosphatase family protein [Chitinophaga agrisoli]
MRPCLFLLSCILFLIVYTAAAQDTAQLIVPGRSNSAAQQQKPYVILISIDGFRYDYAEKFQAQNLLRLSGNGVRARAMQPSFPSLTFPNHYTLATGLYPAHHGLVDNTFYDRSRQKEYRVNNRDAVEDGTWYGGTPLWVLAEQQQMVSASYFWVGSEAPIQDTRPTYYFRYNEKVGIDRRIQQVVEWLSLPADKRPHLITFYFPEVDHAGHSYGPDADSTRHAVQFVDAAIGRMNEAVARLQLPVNFIVVSDHGMIQADTAHALKISKDLLPADFKVAASNEKIMLYNDDPQRVQEIYHTLKAHANHYRVLLKAETPARWHYGQEDRYNRIGDIILLADAGYAFGSSNGRVSPGHHGYDNNQARMNAIFMAWGPAFKQHYTMGAFANIHVYPLVANILNLTINTPIDGDPAVLKNVLRP